MYVWIEAKERSTDVNGVGNQPREYTHNNMGLGTGKIRPQEYLMRLLEGPTRNMAVRSAQTVNNLPADMCMNRGKGAGHRRHQHM